MEKLKVALVDCPSLRMYSDFLKRRGYEIARVPDNSAAAWVICVDHATDPAIEAVGEEFAGPKFVLGADAPKTWKAARALALPLLPLDLEQRLRKLAAPAVAPASDIVVLVVEDDPVILSSVSSAISDGGMTVRGCSSFAHLAASLMPPPHFIVLDLNLPGLSGEQLGDIIRSKQIPTAIFSAEAPQRLEDAKTRIGAVAAFPKEANLASMAAWIRSHVESLRKK